jgi:general secretion pathway protein C
VSANELNVDRSVIDEVLENQFEHLKSIRIAPERKDGNVVGIRLFGVRPGSLLESLGIENGDRLESVNGFDITSPEKALQAYARLRGAGNLTLKINRRGQALGIDYKIK